MEKEDVGKSVCGDLGGHGHHEDRGLWGKRNRVMRECEVGHEGRCLGTRLRGVSEP